ncbi:DUF6146 family protein [Mesonia sp.]|uniref:DUF6146 family protein n=1 Tax=Mesonia sp. TaxID=1960830 RepID=UPI00175FD9D7|nr:DUF6146 family protein [Mesonia sp.]HIB36134.1 hypothetical protein [Mesonia sp.]HIO26627.1 hypothetical protein [Flavobacteriaceae bacterium]
MKNIIAILSIALMIAACSGTQKASEQTASTQQKNDTIRIANDSLEYEIIIIEPGFNSWLVSQRPRGYYSQSYLEQRNWRYVVIYNNRVLSSRYAASGLYPQQIDYQPNIDYGYEVNYLLYNYFLFFQQEYNQNLR